MRTPRLALFEDSTQANKLFCEELRGYTIVFLVGSVDDRPPQFEAWQKQAQEFDISLDVLFKLSDEEKFREIKRSSLMLFPSFFEGFGYPPVEAQYCNVPCVCFDLPVIRETSGDGVYYVPVGDWEAMRTKAAEVLQADADHSHLREHISAVATFESYMARMNAIVDQVMQKPRNSADDRSPTASKSSV